ncbi:MAG: ParB/RepB/Spo0J family partition protein [Candidatus Eremiobacterota bacterium]
MATVKISDIKIKPGRIPVDPVNVSEIAGSIKEIGLINPITITKNNTLIAGLHRIEAMKLLGKNEIPCVKMDIDELRTQIIEIDENIIRQKLHFLDRGEQLRKRKEIYEEIYQDAKVNIFKGNQYIDVPDAPIAFTTDVAEKLNISKRTVQEEIQIAEDLIAEAEEIIREKGMGKKDALLLARKTQTEQLDIVEKIKSEEAKTVKGALKKLTTKKQGKVVNVRIKAELYNKVAELAASEGATTTELIETIIKDFFKYIEDPDPPKRKTGHNKKHLEVRQGK